MHVKFSRYKFTKLLMHFTRNSTIVQHQAYLETLYNAARELER